MTHTPNDGMPQPDETGQRDWFAPPPSQPSDITLSAPVPRPAVPIPGTLLPPRDVLVWPPPPPDEDRSTQPFPALRENRSMPLPPRPAAAPQAAPTPAVPGPATPEPSDPAPSGDAAPSASTGRPRRTLMLGAGAVLSIALAIGLPGWFAYGVYQYGRPSDQVQPVPSGQAGIYQHVSWRVTVERVADPSGKAEAADRQWLKVVATRIALDAEGAIRHGAPEVRLTDRYGRVWMLQEVSNDTPPDTMDNKVGTPYNIQLYGVVPPSVADQVEVVLRPSTYRSVPGQSVSDMVGDAIDRDERQDHVLRFTR
ncbi:hypothetical protein JOL79_14360 [Microbispora sp. RL4-1S]|uniref:Uncharacterized protein n=1 Tax=Microbispora oryzae TaxID=2806554 RepID=A0A940WP73_9ACTN|nr:hypothetical protein [Microbispora oryzae]MBP2705000.1 hypothetical protein [Microbispora oryzae]